MIRPHRTDALLALALAIAAPVETLALEGRSASAAALVVVCLPVAWRRTAPVAAVFACAAGIAAITLANATIENTLPIAALVLCVFSFGTLADRRTLLRVTPVVLVLTELAIVLSGTTPLLPSLLFTGIVFIGLPLGAGRLVRARTALTQRLAEQAEELAAAREQHASRAVADERTRMAADLHALVAAGVRAMVDEAADAERCAATEPERCAEAVGRVEERGRATLVEMRGLLGVLRREDEDLALAPQPSLARLDALATHLARQGRGVDVRVDGDPHPLSPGVDVAAYRVVEEALAAAGPGRADVRVRWEDDHVELLVRSSGMELDDGRALVAPRERVELFGGTARSSPLRGGGSMFLVELPTRDRGAVVA